eukprot:TRINITY_DN8407_c0_g1_i1.p1 TRINITY_DN8407_c0_g1~~TRINITY_DN8407_c0_g1_i1.p1  ORF type:complete len:1031 (-),score=239.80 TRINITY_DN8407_c0_g1_i1:20-3112(-)
MGGVTYGGNIHVTLNIDNGNGDVVEVSRNVGRMPIMVGSKYCHLNGLSPEELIRCKEEANEVGGYFIVNGNEKLVRMLIMQRRNYPVCSRRAIYFKSGPGFSDCATSIRCVNPDMTSQTLTIHALQNGDCKMRLKINKANYFLPVSLILKALVETTDLEIYNAIVQGDYGNHNITDRAERFLEESKALPCYKKVQCLAHIGSRVRSVVRLPSESYTDIQAGEYFLNKFIAIHLDNNQEKFELLIFMIRKVYALLSEEVNEDNSDSIANHEILLGGHMMGMLFKESMQNWLSQIRTISNANMRRSKKVLDITDVSYLNQIFTKIPPVGKKLEYFLATGNIISRTGLDIRQTTGMCIIAEKLNYMRYMAHFRCVHRGQFFAQMRTTSVRKLLPDSWGFLCPVHTPDGAPCGLLNHLTAVCRLSTTDTVSKKGFIKELSTLGMKPVHESGPGYLSIMWNGNIIGVIHDSLAYEFAALLRRMKVSGYQNIPQNLEITVVKKQDKKFPAVYLFSSPARLVRPVLNLEMNTIEIVGTFEQPYLSIAMTGEVEKHTHMEVSKLDMLSMVASLTPFSDYNQSPRNMYQCQMLKQTMGVPCHSTPYRSDNKMYYLHTPQIPVVRNGGHDKYGLDNYLTGTNAVVAVLAYTGYSMEDAMIINKSSHDRGFGNGCIYKTEKIDLGPKKNSLKGFSASQYFHNINHENGELVEETLDEDGLPSVGQRLSKGDPYYVVWDEETEKHKVINYKGKEGSIVEDVAIIGIGTEPNLSNKRLQKVVIKLRLPRRPIRGDKFSSRHGQKGVLSRLIPQEDMPFTENGMTPDIIINPHAFPSRMTIGMLVESMAGKSGVLHGMTQDSSPFTRDRFAEKTVVDEMGTQLASAGFNYYGSEVMYSGVTGEEFISEIYIGVVYYQRLRHMVSDKYQVRREGPRNRLTKQPVKGRKRGGGIRFGEMERDSLLSYGVSFLLHERLMNVSDIHVAHVCNSCGSILSPQNSRGGYTCRYCDTGKHVKSVVTPWVFRYLTNELAAMNIRLSIDVGRI